MSATRIVKALDPEQVVETAKALGPIPDVVAKVLDPTPAAGMKTVNQGPDAVMMKAPDEKPSAKKTAARAAELRETDRKGQEISPKSESLGNGTKGLGDWGLRD
jgi:hypothetical protein